MKNLARATADRTFASGVIEENSIPEPTTGCWLWFRKQGGSTTGASYGIAWWPAPRTGSNKRSVVYAHRLSFFAATGTWPPVVRHRCDQSYCVNPDHLLGGTVADNNADMAARGRYAKGTRNGISKLTDANVEEILRLNGTMSQGAIARRFSVAQATISRIVLHKGWTHISRREAK